MAEAEKVIDMPLGTKQISEVLTISESAIRKYALALEKAGYEFEKSGTTRHFKNDDVEVFRLINHLTENSKLNVEHAVAVVMTSTRTVAKEEEKAVVSTEQPQHDQSLATIQNQIQMQGNLIQNLVETFAREQQVLVNKIEQQQQQIEKLEQINKDSNDKLQLAVDMIQKIDGKLDKLEEKEKRSFFKRLFG